MVAMKVPKVSFLNSFLCEKNPPKSVMYVDLFQCKYFGKHTAKGDEDMRLFYFSSGWVTLD